jgi:adenosine kinase
MIVGFCNPLLDITAPVEPELLSNYNLKANNAILAGPEHAGLAEFLQKNYSVTCSAAGAGLNTIRGAQHLLSPHSTRFFGCIGDDLNGKILESAALKDGLDPCYMITQKDQTGTCVCLLTPGSRSLIATLGAANHYSHTHLIDNFDLKVKDATIIYITGFFCTVSPQSIDFIIDFTKNSSSKVLLAMNLSAPFISEFYSETQIKLVEAADIVFGNESEARAFASKHNFQTQDVAEIALKISELDDKRPKMVVITQGQDETIVVKQDKSIEKFAVEPVENIVDTNGAGDCFVGGFLAGLHEDKPLPECVNMGHALAAKIISRMGVYFE